MLNYFRLQIDKITKTWIAKKKKWEEVDKAKKKARYEARIARSEEFANYLVHYIPTGFKHKHK